MATTTVTIDPQVVADAANFLEGFLSDSDPTGDYTKGTALRDHTIGALAAIFAYLRAESTQVRQLQSFNSIQAATNGDPTALQDATTAILSNLLVALNGGTLARGIAVGHASQAVDMFIQPTHRFTRSSGIVFVVDAPSTFFIPATDLVPIIDASGVVLEYEFNIPLVATHTGPDYNIDPGFFSNFSNFSPYVTRVENQAVFQGGNPAETPAEAIARAPTAISVRNLINDRSIQATLDENFSEIKALFVAGMGDSEMQRDLTVFSSALQVHIGGMVDIYPLLPVYETTFFAQVDGLFERPDGIACILRDATLPLNFPVTIQPGDIVNVTAGFPTIPRQFKVVENLGVTLLIDPRNPFPVITDELTPSGAVSYTVGRVAPRYVDLLSGPGGTPLPAGTTSRRVQTSGRISLPGGPVMDILDVAIINPASAESAFVDSVDGYIHFPNHVNQTPSQAQTPDQGLQYQTIIHNPLEAQSNRMWLEFVVGTDTDQARFDGYTLRVRYQTLSGFSSIDAFVTGRNERTVAASQLVRGHNPIIVSTPLTLPISYKLRADAPSTLNNSVIAQTISDFINAFDTTVVPIDTSAIVDLIRSTYPTIASVLPIFFCSP